MERGLGFVCRWAPDGVSLLTFADSHSICLFLSLHHSFAPQTKLTEHILCSMCSWQTLDLFIEHLGPVLSALIHLLTITKLGDTGNLLTPNFR